MPPSGSQASQDLSQLKIIQRGYISLPCLTWGGMVHLQPRESAKPGAVHSGKVEPWEYKGPEMELQSEAGGLEFTQSPAADPIQWPRKGDCPSEATTAVQTTLVLEGSSVWLRGLSSSLFLPDSKLVDWYCPCLGWVCSIHWLRHQIFPWGPLQRRCLLNCFHRNPSVQSKWQSKLTITSSLHLAISVHQSCHDSWPPDGYSTFRYQTE